jgi:hypothetical protein
MAVSPKTKRQRQGEPRRFTLFEEHQTALEAPQKGDVYRVGHRPSLALIEDTVTVHDGQAVIVAVPRKGTTDVNRFQAKQQIRPSG